MTDKIMPRAIYEGMTSPVGIDMLLHKNTPERIQDDCDYWNVEEDRYLLGYVIPPFQRHLVWSLAQKVKFIESVWLGFHLGTYVVNKLDAPNHPMSHILIDGLQRLSTIKEYVENGFPVFGHYYDGVTRRDKVQFERTPFSCEVVNLSNEKILREVYNRLNFGGTPHTDDQRA